MVLLPTPLGRWMFSSVISSAGCFGAFFQDDAHRPGHCCAFQCVLGGGDAIQNPPIALLDTVKQHSPTETQLPGDASINALVPFLFEHHYSCKAINRCIYLRNCRKSVSVWASTCGGPGRDFKRNGSPVWSTGASAHSCFPVFLISHTCTLHPT